MGHDEQRLNLDWPTRIKICLGIARGLAYLHGESRLKIVCRDIKARNVLLDKYLNAKISDFGLAKLDEEETPTSAQNSWNKVSFSLISSSYLLLYIKFLYDIRL